MEDSVWFFVMNIHERFNTWRKALQRKMTLKVTNVLGSKMSEKQSNSIHVLFQLKPPVTC
jgi:hypothetical protein